MNFGASTAFALTTAVRNTSNFLSTYSLSKQTFCASLNLFALPFRKRVNTSNHNLIRPLSASSNIDILHTYNNTFNSSMTSTNMRRGIGGRIEDAFASAKDRGEAAFVSFVTAGYPSPEGECGQV
jgi:hypothetical protein